MAIGKQVSGTTVRDRWMFGSGGVVTGVISNGIVYFLLFYYNQVIGLPGFYAGAAILISLVFDSITDPIVGIWSDNSRSRWGRRHPFMYAALIPVPVLYVLVWFPPELSDFGLFIYLTITVTLLRFFSTLFEIPAQSLIAELSQGYDERTQLASMRTMMTWYGGLVAAILMWGYFLVNWGELNRTAYQLAGVLSAVMIFIGIVTSSVGLHHRIPDLRTYRPRVALTLQKLLSDLLETLANRNFLALFLSAFFAAIAAGVKGNFETFIMLHFWEFSPEQVQWLYIALLGSTWLAAFLTPKLTRRYDKKASVIVVYATSIVVAALPYILRLIEFFPSNDSPYLYPVLIVHQVVDVTLIIIAAIILYSMLADVVEENETRTGRREEGVFFSASTFAAKATAGVGVFFAGVSLDLIQFPSGAVPGEVPADIVWNLGFIYGPALMIFFTIALYCITFYRITREDHEQRVIDLRE